jgi:hypothetical protein
MLDFRNFNTSETLASNDNQSVWLKAETEDKIYFIPTYVKDPDTANNEFIGNLPAAVVKFNGPCYAIDDAKISIQNSLLYILEVLNINISGINGFQSSESFSVSRIFMKDNHHGQGYRQETTTVTIIPGPGDTPTSTATAVPVVERGQITSINIINRGFGYTKSPFVSISGDGTGAFGYAILKRADSQSCGIPNNSFTAKIERAVDSSSINQMGKCPKYVTPTSAVIPLRSNIRTYGPYISTNFGSDTGGVVLSEDRDLSPWVFGSLAAANAAGQARANEFPELPLKISEAGSATVVGLPNLSLGQRLNTIGPFLNSINMTFGSNGVTTNLNFQTFTPQFGQVQESVREQLIKLNATRQKQLQFIRQQSIDHTKISQKVTKNLTSANRQSSTGRQENLKDKNTLQRVIIGENYTWTPPSGSPAISGQRIVVGLDKLLDSQLEMKDQWSNKAFMSLDGIFSPISISGGGLPTSGEIFLPRYASILSSGINHRASPAQPQPPFTTGSNSTSSISGHQIYNLDIKNLNLNPLTNPSGNPYSSGVCAGHSIDIVGRGSGVPESGLINSFYTSYSGTTKYSDDYRFLGLRGPLVLHSWGYDTDGKPIPNIIDNEIQAKSGIFNTESSGIGLKDQFLDNWLQKPATWPVGPVDLRFDRERGMWVAPQPYRTVVARITQDVSSYGSGLAAIINKDATKSYGHTLYDSSGNPVLEDSTASSSGTNLPIITIVDRIGNSHSIGDMVYAHYDTYTSEYIILGGQGGSPGTNIKVAKAVGNWNKFAIKGVTVFDVSTPASGESYLTNPRYDALVENTGNAIYAMNLFANIVDADEYWCVLAQLDNNYHILLSAECGC